jgi:hypothetical protein
MRPGSLISLHGVVLRNKENFAFTVIDIPSDTGSARFVSLFCKNCNKEETCFHLYECALSLRKRKITRGRKAVSKHQTDRKLLGLEEPPHQVKRSILLDKSKLQRFISTILIISRFCPFSEPRQYLFIQILSV